MGNSSCQICLFWVTSHRIHLTIFRHDITPFYYLSLAAIGSLQAQTAGKLTYEKWNNLASTKSAEEVIRDGIAKRLPDTVSEVATASVVNFGSQCGVRLRGYVTAPVTGRYTFFVAGDDGSILYLSEDDSAANKKRVAYSVYHTAGSSSTELVFSLASQ